MAVDEKLKKKLDMLATGKVSSIKVPVFDMQVLALDCLREFKRLDDLCQDGDDLLVRMGEERENAGMAAAASQEELDASSTGPVGTEVAFVLTGHSQYHDDVWLLINKVGFCNELTPVGWLLACGCTAETWVEGDPDGKDDGKDPTLPFGVTIRFNGPRKLLLARLENFLKHRLGLWNCERVS